MEIDEFTDSLASLQEMFKHKSAKKVNTDEEKNAVRAVAATWFRTFRPLFARLLGSEAPLESIDVWLQDLLRLATSKSARSSYISLIQKTRKAFKDTLLVSLTKAYWEQLPQTSSSDYHKVVGNRLEAMEPSLRDSYEQVIRDLSSDERKSFKGTANELRELLREVLHRLAPDGSVRKQSWFRSAHPNDADSARPNHAERTKFILRLKGRGSAFTEAAENHAEAVEDRLGRVVRSSYSRASASAHTHQAKEEIQAQLRYLNALFLELLPEPGVG
ncbi:MAG: hypothetical protein WBF13_02730 [Candidatus Zixiibacteriota bacterium]